MTKRDMEGICILKYHITRYFVLYYNILDVIGLSPCEVRYCPSEAYLDIYNVCFRIAMFFEMSVKHQI